MRNHKIITAISLTIKHTLLSVAFALLALSKVAVAQPDVVAMIEQADRYRLENESSKVVSLVKLYENEKLDKTREYEVYTRPNRESLVLFKSKVESGQKMLMLGDNYWLVMPKSRRPIRITPMQKLLGEASVGDVSTLTWSQDYQGDYIGSEPIYIDSENSLVTERLLLKSKTAGASYQKIDLWLEPGSNFPIRADLYLRSGKLAKQAWFKKGEQKQASRVVEMTLLDQIQPHKKTVIEYQDVTPQTLPDKFYNPAYLTKNRQLNLE